MRVLILAFCGILLVGSTGAFLLYVSILSILSVVVVLMAIMFMFLLGVQVERQRPGVPEIPSENMMHHIQETRMPINAPVLATVHSHLTGNGQNPLTIAGGPIKPKIFAKIEA